MNLTPSQIATLVAIGFQTYRRQFQSSTRRAAARFESRDWASIRRDNLERRDAYGSALEATIQSVTDAGYDTTDRDAWSEAKAVEYIKKLSGTQFDPRVTKAFFDMIDLS